MTTRRDFIKGAAVTAAGISIAPGIASGFGSNAPSDRMNVGLIGCNGMGFSDLSEFLNNPNVKCLALCDIDESVLNRRAADVEKKTGAKPANLYKDWRKLIDNKDINLVIVGTPDHWHCLQMVAACEAGKDVYCEKPIGRTIEECNIMVKAAQKNKSVVQVGQWQRSDPHWLDAVDFLRSGKLGKIRIVRVYSYQGWNTSIPVVPDGPAPAGVDYDMWLGPAPKRPFNKNRFHFTFRWFWDYAGGLMTDWGVHLLDFALFGMNVTAPKSIMAMGGKYGYPDDACETPDSLQTIYEFDGFNVMWDHAIGINDGGYGRNAVLGFVGENGTLVVDRGGWEVIPEKVNGKTRMEAKPWVNGVNKGLPNHVKNHLECIAKRDRNTKASPEIAAHIAKFSALGNIAYRTGKKLVWDGTKFTNDTDANTYLVPKYRAPWSLPKI
ncbi:MAG TPA: Gfo/Idh/MocA family oxidoreductase, partial [Bacteroidales bacterium]|jgi:predicted dehydrogenase|nr:Gfo/Idh/MocA family oxidoreductase [Bacteroidales bacterium]